MATPCSVKAYGAARLRPPQLEVTICDFKLRNFSSVSWNMKSAGKPCGLNQCPRFYMIEVTQIGAEHGLVAAQKKDSAFNPFGEDGDSGFHFSLARLGKV